MTNFLATVKKNLEMHFPLMLQSLKESSSEVYFEIQLEAIVKYLVLAPCKLGSQYIHSEKIAVF